jgi:hypothetical protein
VVGCLPEDVGAKLNFMRTKEGNGDGEAHLEVRQPKSVLSLEMRAQHRHHLMSDHREP